MTIEDDQTYEGAPRNPAGDVIQAIGRYTAVLEDETSSAEDKANAVRFLTHFVGDIHQPLHVGRGADRGGNGVSLRWFGRESNLHRVWDSEMIDQHQLSYSELADFLDRLSYRQVRDWQRSEPLDWAMESFSARPDVYDLPENHELGYDYLERHRRLVQLRLRQAGVRLAALFERIFR